MEDSRKILIDVSVKGQIEGIVCPVCYSAEVIYEGDIKSLDETGKELPYSMEYTCIDCLSVFVIIRLGERATNKMLRMITN